MHVFAFLPDALFVDTALITSPLLASIPGIRHGFGSLAAPIPPVLLEHWLRRPDKKQVHGDQVAQVTHVQQACGDVDGVYSALPDIPISVITADCVPILLARRDGKKIAALHAGWRGLIGGIVDTFWRDLAGQSKDPQDHPSQWVASVGPAIGACCYEVSPELAEQFVAHFSSLPAALVLPRERHLDLPAIARHALLNAGVGEVDIVRHCTRCSLDAHQSPRLRSYRRGDRGSHQHSGLIILA